jgi:hypothetical protein
MRKLKNMYQENSEYQSFILYHAALVLEDKEMIEDLNKFVKKNPKEFIELLQESKDSFEKIQHLLEPKNADLIDRMLKDPSYQPSNHLLYSIFSQIWERIPAIRSSAVKLTPA